MLDGLREILKPEIYFTMDVEGDRTLDLVVPTTYFIDFPVDLPSFCYETACLHVHMSKEELGKNTLETIRGLLKNRKEILEKKAGKRIRYFRPGWMLSNEKLVRAANELGMEIIGTDVRYYTAWLPKKRIIFIVHSYNSRLYITLLIFYLKFFHPFGKWKVFR
jgi:hypothetical protein